MSASGFDPMAESKAPQVVPFSTQQLLVSLKYQEGTPPLPPPSPSFNLAWKAPELFEQLLDQRGPEVFNQELHLLGMEACVALIPLNEEKVAEPRIALRVLHQVLADQKLAAQFAQVVKKQRSKPDEGGPKAAGIAEFLEVTTGLAPAKPGWLSRAFSSFAVSSLGNDLTRVMCEVFDKQSPEAQLRILLSSPTMADREEPLEDCIHNDPLTATEALFLQVDMPLMVGKKPEIYRRKTLEDLPSPHSPFSRKPFNATKDFCSWSEWSLASPERRFVTIVRQNLRAEQNLWLQDSDILRFIQSPLLVKYIKTSRLYLLFERLDKMYPWDAAVKSEWVQELREQLARAFFPPTKSGWIPSRVELEVQVANLEKLQKEALAPESPMKITPIPSVIETPTPAPEERLMSRCCL